MSVSAMRRRCSVSGKSRKADFGGQKGEKISVQAGDGAGV